MRSLIAIVTGLHVLAHGIFGCCDHRPTAISSTATTCECHTARHHNHDDHHAEPMGDCAASNDDEAPGSTPHRCMHSCCHWVVGTSAAQQHLLDAPASVALELATAPLATALHAAEFWPDATAGHFSAPPLRLHLAFGVMQI